MNALTLDLVRERYRQNLQILNYSPRTLHSHVPYFNRLGEFMAEAKVDDLAGFTGQTGAALKVWPVNPAKSSTLASAMNSPSRLK